MEIKMKNYSFKKLIGDNNVPHRTDRFISQPRNYGLDGLKGLCMFMIVILHFTNHGGIFKASEIFSLRYETIRFLQTLSICAVDCFAMISGYLLVDKEHNGIFNMKRIFNLWLQVFFYSVIIGVVCFFLGKISIKSFIKSFFPIMANQYWYFTEYFALFWLIPFLNILIKSISKTKSIVLFCVLFGLFSVIPTIRIHTFFHLEYGYSVWWLAIMYIFGGLTKKYKNEIQFPAIKGVIIYAITIIGICICSNILLKITLSVFDSRKGEELLLYYTCPLIVLCAWLLLNIFSQFSVYNSISCKILKFIGNYSFGVYLIHDNPIVRELFFENTLYKFLSENLIILVLEIIFGAFLIFCLGMILDYVRSKLFKAFRLPQFVQMVDSKVNQIFKAKIKI